MTCRRILPPNLPRKNGKKRFRNIILVGFDQAVGVGVSLVDKGLPFLEGFKGGGVVFPHLGHHGPYDAPHEDVGLIFPHDAGALAEQLLGVQLLVALEAALQAAPISIVLS